jgi:hypothetical protein
VQVEHATGRVVNTGDQLHRPLVLVKNALKFTSSPCDRIPLHGKPANRSSRIRA